MSVTGGTVAQLVFCSRLYKFMLDARGRDAAVVYCCTYAAAAVKDEARLRIYLLAIYTGMSI